MASAAADKLLERRGPAKAPRSGLGAPYHKGNVKRRLIEAARSLLQVEALEAVTARRLCREIGVSSANFYNHFPSLEHLFVEVAADGFASRAAENRRLVKRGWPREAMLTQLAQNLVEFSIVEPQLFQLMFGRIAQISQHPKFVEAADDSFRVIVEIVYGDDLYRADDLELSHETCKAAYAFFAFIYGLARCLSQGLIANPTGTRSARRRFVEGLTRQMIEGLGR